LVLIGVLMIIIENKPLSNKGKMKRWEDISVVQAVTIGFSQALALIPGTSRSGATTVTGVLLGLEKYAALQFSFILGAPVLLGTFLYEVIKTPNSIGLLLQVTTLIG